MNPVLSHFLSETIWSVPEHAHAGERGPGSTTRSITAIVLAWRDFEVGATASPTETVKKNNKRSQCFPKCVLRYVCLVQ